MIVIFCFLSFLNFNTGAVDYADYYSQKTLWQQIREHKFTKDDFQTMWILIKKVCKLSFYYNVKKIEQFVEICNKFPVHAFYLGIIFLIYGFLCCWPLMLIAQKYEEQAWLAWIPIINLALMVKLADKPFWLFITLFIPALTIFVMIYIWISIAQVMRKPAILGVLIVVPFLNILMLWNLALDKKAQYFGSDNDRRLNTKNLGTEQKDRREH